MRFKASIFVIAVATIGQTFAYTIEDLEKGILKCAEIENRGDKIVCYEKVANDVKNKGIEPEIAKSDAIQNTDIDLKDGNSKHGNWSVDITTNKKDDSKTVILMNVDLSSKDYLGRYRAIGIRCKEGNVDLMINWNDYLANYNQVTHRIDSEKAITANWNNSTSGDNSFYAKDAKRFLLSLIGKKKFYAETTAYRKGTVSLSANLDGFDEAIKPVRKVCKF